MAFVYSPILMPNIPLISTGSMIPASASLRRRRTAACVFHGILTAIFMPGRCITSFGGRQGRHEPDRRLE